MMIWNRQIIPTESYRINQCQLLHLAGVSLIWVNLISQVDGSCLIAIIFKTYSYPEKRISWIAAICHDQLKMQNNTLVFRQSWSRYLGSLIIMRDSFSVDPMLKSRRSSCHFTMVDCLSVRNAIPTSALRKRVLQPTSSSPSKTSQLLRRCGSSRSGPPLLTLIS